MYQPDLSPYCYALPDQKPLERVLAVGWLEKECPTGTFPPALFEKLLAYYDRFAMRKCYGYHHCPFCPEYPTRLWYGEKEFALGSREIWLPFVSGDGFYAAPDLMLHYCAAHHYLPPEPFLSALEKLDLEAMTVADLLRQIKTCSLEVLQNAYFDLILTPGLNTLSEEDLDRFLRNRSEDCQNPANWYIRRPTARQRIQMFFRRWLTDKRGGGR